MESLRRKLNNRAEMRFAAAAARNTQALGRTTQAAHSTIAVGDADIPLVETVEEARDTAIELPAVAAEVEVAADDAYEAAINVDAAHAAAENAVADALLAKQTADGKNSIYSQAITPVAHPDRPFKQSDVWYETIVVDGNTRIATVNVWDGEKWTPNALVGNSLLVPGSVGNVLIENGAISGVKIAADAIDGMRITAPEIFGGRFVGNSFEGALFSGTLIEGSTFSVKGVASETTRLTDPMTSITAWTAGPGVTKASDTTVFNTASPSLRLTSPTPPSVSRTYTAMTFPGDLVYSVWARSPQPLTVQVSYRNFVSVRKLEPNVWTKIEMRFGSPQAETVTISTRLDEGETPSSSYTLYLDDVLVVSRVFSTSELIIGRDAAGLPSLRMKNASGLQTVSLDANGALALTSATTSMSLSPGAMTVRRGALGAATVVTPDGITSDIFSNRFYLTQDGRGGLEVRDRTNAAQNPGLVLSSANGPIDLTPGNGQPIRLNGAAVATGTFVNPGNTFALKSQLDAWAPIDGTHAWVAATGWEYIRARGKWIVNSTNGEVDITSSLLAAYRGNMSYSVAGGTLFLNINAVGAIGVGQTVVGNLPSELRPAGLMAGAARLSSDYAGSFLVNAAGAVVAATRTGVTHTTATGSVAYAAP